jgi:hypothetical protein
VSVAKSDVHVRQEAVAAGARWLPVQKSHRPLQVPVAFGVPRAISLDLRRCVGDMGDVPGLRARTLKQTCCAVHVVGRFVGVAACTPVPGQL